MSERGKLAAEARRIAAEHKVSLRQAYRYVAKGRPPSGDVRIGADGRRYHVWLSGVAPDRVQARRIRYMVAHVGRRAAEHGIVETDLAELETAARRLAELTETWRAWLGKQSRL
jgi:hypothetical protein